MQARFYIKGRDQNPELQCSICFEPHFQLLECEGPCRKRVCKGCMSQIVKPAFCRYCSEVHNSVRFASLEVRFRCPADCGVEMASESQFDVHCRNCGKIDESIKENFKLKRQYRCEKGHRLRFPDSRNGHCAICGDTHYASRCRQCKLQYCTKCRPPPCSKEQCPLGHNFHLNEAGRHVICDLCGISQTILAPDIFYGDRECNFDACYFCHSKFPEDHPLPDYKVEAATFVENRYFNQFDSDRPVRSFSDEQEWAQQQFYPREFENIGMYQRKRPYPGFDHFGGRHVDICGGMEIEDEANDEMGCEEEEEEAPMHVEEDEIINGHKPNPNFFLNLIQQSLPASNSALIGMFKQNKVEEKIEDEDEDSHEKKEMDKQGLEQFRRYQDQDEFGI